MLTSRILKWPVEINDSVQEIGGGEVVFVAVQDGVLCAWTREVVGQSIAMRRVRVVGTGHEFDSRDRSLGSAQMAYFVWHLIETVPEQ